MSVLGWGSRCPSSKWSRKKIYFFGLISSQGVLSEELIAAINSLPNEQNGIRALRAATGLACINWIMFGASLVISGTSPLHPLTRPKVSKILASYSRSLLLTICLSEITVNKTWRFFKLWKYASRLNNRIHLSLGQQYVNILWILQSELETKREIITSRPQSTPADITSDFRLHDIIVKAW